MFFFFYEYLSLNVYHTTLISHHIFTEKEWQNLKGQAPQINCDSSIFKLFTPSMGTLGQYKIEVAFMFSNSCVYYKLKSLLKNEYIWIISSIQLS